jgi:hypothetical protein
MRQLSVIEFVTLDGVMRGLGSPDEDRDGGFEHGGWAAPDGDQIQQAAALEGNRLFLHPLLLGTGKRLFGERDHPQPPRPLQLLCAESTSTGVVMLSYQCR